MGTESNSAGRAAEAREQQRQADIRSGRASIDSTFGQFDDAYYDRVGQASLDQNLPQVTRQFDDARKQLLFGLARIGQLNGTVSARRNARLAGDRQTALARTNELAATARRGARQNVEAERRTLFGQLEATSDPAIAAQGASAAAAALREQPPIEQVGTLFENATVGLGFGLQPQFDSNGINTGSRLGNLLNRANRANAGSARTVNG